MELKLPMAMATKHDIGVVIRELKLIDDYVVQDTIRHLNQKSILPRLSRHLELLVQDNKLDLIDTTSRRLVLKVLSEIKASAPVIHISLSADPSPAFIVGLVEYLRSEIDPRVLIEIGREPTIAAGCYVRTTNRYFDFSLNHFFQEKRALLSSLLSGEPL